MIIGQSGLVLDEWRDGCSVANSHRDAPNMDREESYSLNWWPVREQVVHVEPITCQLSPVRNQVPFDSIRFYYIPLDSIQSMRNQYFNNAIH